jgi:hypothetical protein
VTQQTATRLRSLTSTRSHQAPRHAARSVTMPVLRVGCAALITWIGYIHLHLWQEGYRQIPVNGPLFLLAAIAAFVLAAILLIWPRPLAGLVAAGFTAVTLGSLIISLTIGLFGFNESIHASFVVQSLVIETIAVVALLMWTTGAARPGGSAPAIRR